MVTDQVWKDGVLDVFETLQLYEMESSYFIDEPEMDLKFVEMFVKKIGYGINRGGKVTSADTDLYTTYYIDEVHKILPKDAETAGGGKRQISGQEWEDDLVKMRRILSFEDWVALSAKPLADVLKEHDKGRDSSRTKADESTSEKKNFLIRKKLKLMQHSTLQINWIEVLQEINSKHLSVEEKEHILQNLRPLVEQVLLRKNQ